MLGNVRDAPLDLHYAVCILKNIFYPEATG